MKKSTTNIQAPDLTKRPPRSPRVRLGGYVILPRILDKGRAVLAGTNGEYKYACSMDQQFLIFAGIDAKALQAELVKGKGDGEILTWIQAKAKNQHSAAAIAAWSAYQEQRPPADPDSREFFNDEHKRIAPQREDISTWFDYLDLDDYASFGGPV
jgi:hypothetical protein